MQSHRVHTRWHTVHCTCIISLFITAPNQCLTLPTFHFKEMSNTTRSNQKTRHHLQRSFFSLLLHLTNHQVHGFHLKVVFESLLLISLRFFDPFQSIAFAEDGVLFLKYISYLIFHLLELFQRHSICPQYHKSPVFLHLGKKTSPLLSSFSSRHWLEHFQFSSSEHSLTPCLG